MSDLRESDRIAPLPFRVDPHMLEDLGLNLYSSLARVLVEFVANSYDADADKATVRIDFERIEAQRKAMRAEWKEELEAAGDELEGIKPLEERLLPEDTVISIEDTGHGMSSHDLESKFLVAGRRRRVEEDRNTSPKGRILMGRKGVGKLAGFGVARVVEVVTKMAGAERAHAIRLDFDEIMRLDSTASVEVPAYLLPDDGGLGEHGTRITLSKLVHESVRNREDTVRHRIGDHFVEIEQDDFAIDLNGTLAAPTQRVHAFAWPEPDRELNELVTHRITAEESGRPVEFDFRLRFVEDRAALMASQRGVRVYAHKRLAAAPSLLDADTNMHGFRMTDYLDGVVFADFLDDLERDYIATDRQGLRWETPLLKPVHDFLSEQIKVACAQYQKVRDARKREEVDDDSFTSSLITEAQLSRKETRLAKSVCTSLAGFHQRGVDTPEYREHARLLVGAIGKGEVFSAISAIGNQSHPQLHDLASQITRLTHAEIDQTLSWMRSRLLAIRTLERIVADVDFNSGNNEDELHRLLKESPWLIDPTYFEFLTSNRAARTLFRRLEAKLRTGQEVPEGYDKSAPSETEPLNANRRPDLVFLLGNEGLRRLVIVELKAPNTPLHHEHLMQLKDYMRQAEAFLRDRNDADVSVEACLIGTLDRGINANEVQRLTEELNDRGPTTKWQVFDIAVLLERTRNAHKEMLDLHEQTAGEDEELED